MSLAAMAMVVTVCMNGEASVTYPGRAMASQIFAKVGVKLDWHRPAACPDTPGVIKISFGGQAPKGMPKDALAYALPYEGAHIVVFSERLKLEDCPPNKLLAYVLVHEITHVLQGIARHSDTGIMKAHWDYTEYHQMRREALGFTADDVYWIHRGVDRRAVKAFAGVY